MQQPAIHRHFQALVVLICLMGVVASRADETKPFDLPAAAADVSLGMFMNQSGLDVLYVAGITAGVTTNAVKGEMMPVTAIDRMLAGTPLSRASGASSGVIRIARQAGDRNHSADGARTVPQPDSQTINTMNPDTNTSAAPRKKSFWSRIFGASLMMAGTASAQPGSLQAETDAPMEAAVQPWAVSGAVSSAETNNFLEGVLVEIPSLQLQTITDRNGRFSLDRITATDVMVVISYTGMRTQSIPISSTGERRLDVVMSPEDVLVLQPFSVAVEREGNAASITRQRTAINVKNVVAMDAFGNLPNEGVGEVLLRFPGVAGEFDAQENVSTVSVRGASAGMTPVSIDGNLQASNSGFGRDFRLNYVSGALFEEIDVTKGLTPEMSAEGLGGAVNLRTRSPLKLQGKRRVNYRAAARWAPDFYSHTPLRRDDAVHPLLSVGYQEVFSVFGKERNLGVSINAFYSENVAGYYQTLQDYEYTLASPAYIWDYRMTDALINRKQQSVNLKMSYRLSEHVEVYLNGLYNDAPTANNEQYIFRAFTGRTVATIGANGQPTGTGAIMPGYTDARTEVRPVNASIVQLNTTNYSFFARERQVNLGAIHTYDRLKLDYDYAYSRSHTNLGNSMSKDNAGGVFTMQIPGVGWVLDKAISEAYPDFSQTAGPEITNGANYGTGQMTSRDNKRNSDIYNFSANAQWKLGTPWDLGLKTGVRWRNQEVNEIVVNDRQWTKAAAGSFGVLENRGLLTSFESRTGMRLPFVEGSLVTEDIRRNPNAWTENHYYAAMRRYAGTRSVAEDISAGYLQGSARAGALSLLGGFRVERTDVESEGWVRGRVQTNAAQRAADPDGSAAADFVRRDLRGSYSDLFPSAHLTYRFSKGLVGRASWSNSIGRPSMSDLLPLETVNTNQETVTISNPELKPQHSENWDFSLEYYFEPVGVLSVSHFRKNITDFLVTGRGGVGVVGSGPDNGFGGDYAGYTLLSRSNGGSADVSGWEFNYQQQLSFLPGWAKGFSVFANYTTLDTKGDYGSEDPRSTDKVAGFVPEAANFGVTYKNRAWSARLVGNHTSGYLTTYDANPARLRFRDGRTLFNLGLSYQVRPWLEFSADIVNMFNKPQRFYRGSEDRLQTWIVNGTSVTLGVSGRF